MLMFRFWGSERGSETTVEACHPMPALTKPPHNLLLGSQPSIPHSATSSACSLKRRRQSLDDRDSGSTTDDAVAGAHPLKRAKMAADGLPEPAAALDDAPRLKGDWDDVRDAIQYQFGFEILRKHNELRLINQELAKCQVALEQLRRCHLIPYPVTCPTPDQMLDIANGKGPALQSRPGLPPPRWAAPFGVVEGPYARHYAKWLIPDPKFDGMQPEWQPVFDTGRKTVSSQEGRTTRNSYSDLGSVVKGRAGRGMSGQKLHSLSSGYPQPKEKAGPCVLKRSDGQTVKLVCIDCNRENFSSTQGFINHCRIAHRRDFKSHEEAAVHSGHPIEVPEPAVAATVEDKSSTAAVAATTNPVAPAAITHGPPSGLVHPFAQAELTTQQAYVALRSRIADSLKLYHQGKLPGVTSIPTAQPQGPSPVPADQFVSAGEAPFLSRLLQSRKFTGDLSELVRDAKQKDVMEDFFSPGEESCEETEHSAVAEATVPAHPRAPVVMRVPARTAVPTAPLAIPAATRPTSSSKTHPSLMGFASPLVSSPDKEDDVVMMASPVEDVDMDADLSPNTLVSNNAPSLVSDDGEYDDSDDGSSDSGASDNMDATSVSDVTEINIDDDHEARSIRHHRGSASSTAMRLKKEDNKHVTFISPVKNNTGNSTNNKRARKV